MCRAEDHYQVLGLQRGATDKEIGAAYKRLALRHHPDKNPDNQDQAQRAFLKITQAYEALRDPATRQAYDHRGGPRQPGWAQGARYASEPARGGAGFGACERAEDLYRAYFGAGFGEESAPRIDVAGIFSFLDTPGSQQDGRHQSKCAASAHTVPAGTAVGLRGLRSRPELNGKSAKVGEWNEAKGRYEVRLQDGTVLSLRPQNLVQQCPLEVADSEERPDLRGRRGEVVEYSEETGRYTVLMHDPALIAELPGGSCVLSAGTRVTLRELSDEQLNGQMAQILSVDRNAARYLVQCQSGRQVRVKFSKVLC